MHKQGKGKDKKLKNYNPGFYVSNPVVINMPPLNLGAINKKVAINLAANSVIVIQPRPDPRSPGREDSETMADRLPQIPEEAVPAQPQKNQANIQPSKCCWPFSICF